MIPNRSERPEGRWPWLTLISLCLCLSLRAETVVLTLKNGDRLTGEFKSENAERVVIKSSIAGTLKVPKDQIAKREPLNPPAPAVTATPPAPAAPPAKPAVAPAAAPKPAVAAAPVTNSVTTTNLVTHWNDWLPEFLRPFTTNWHGNLNVGLNLGFGTTDRQTYYGNARASHSYQRLRNTAMVNASYGTVNSRETDSRINGSLRTDFDLGKKRKVYLYNNGGAGHDGVRRVDLEFNEGVGIGYKFIEKPRFILTADVGAEYQSIDYETAPDRDFIAARLGQSLTWKVSDKLTITQQLSFSPNVSDVEDYRVRFELRAAYPLFKRVTISVNVVDQYDSKPALTVDKNDLQVQSLLGVTF